MGCTDSRQSLKGSQSTSRGNKGSRGLQRRDRDPRGSYSEETRDETASSAAFGDCSSKMSSMEPEVSAPVSPLYNVSSVVTERRATLAEMESLSDLDKTLTDDNEDCDNGHSEGRCCCSCGNDTGKSDRSKPRTSATKTASALNGSHNSVAVITGEQNKMLQQKNHSSHSNSNTNRLAKVSNAQRKQDQSQNEASSNAKNTVATAKAKPKSSSTKSHKKEKQKQEKGNVRNDSSNKKSKSLRHHSKHSKAEDGEAAARDAHFQHQQQQQLGRQNSETARSLALGGLRSTLVDLAPYASAFVVVPLTLEQDAVGNLLKHALNLAAPASDALLPSGKKNWIQLSGHPGTLIPAGAKRVWKRQTPDDCREETLYPHLMSDVIRSLVPQYYGRIVQNGENFIELEDLLYDFINPSIMDIKMGTRTFTETEVENTLPREDLYDKMTRIDPSAPTADEHAQKAVTKMRYMQFRERESSTATLGFRIDALRVTGEEPNRNLQTIKSPTEVSLVMKNFFRSKPELMEKLIDRLLDMQQILLKSTFFFCHEIIGSSILIVLDHRRVGAWMIDFAKTTPLADGQRLTHKAEWQPGNREDGYLVGLDNLIQILTQREDTGAATAQSN